MRKNQGNSPKIKEAAEWMLKELERTQFLHQQVAVYELKERFGDGVVYINDQGNDAISKQVLDEFKKLTEGAVIWERGEKVWRKREDFDAPGRQQN